VPKTTCGVISCNDRRICRILERHEKLVLEKPMPLRGSQHETRQHLALERTLLAALGQDVPSAPTLTVKLFKAKESMGVVTSPLSTVSPTPEMAEATSCSSPGRSAADTRTVAVSESSTSIVTEEELRTHSIRTRV
jgi:hypothetical protein